MKILWASPHCLFNNIDGASILSLSLLKGLRLRGHEVFAVTITSNPNNSVREKKLEIYEIDGLQVASLAINSTHEEGMTNAEINDWLSLYMSSVELFSPDTVIGYGGMVLDMHVYSYAKFRNIQTCALLLNTSYNGKYWCKDVDKIFTDSQFTSDFYAKKFSIPSVALGPYIDPKKYLDNSSVESERNEILFINSIPSKGALIVAQLIFEFQEINPNIIFHMVDGRGSAKKCIDYVANAIGCDSEKLKNYKITGSFTDTVGIFKKARCLMAPSLADESLGLVALEAAMNLVPTIGIANGGLVEAISDRGIIIDIPEIYRSSPYNKLLESRDLNIFIEAINKLFLSNIFYDDIVSKCEHYKRQFNGSGYFDRLENLLRC